MKILILTFTLVNSLIQELNKDEEIRKKSTMKTYKTTIVLSYSRKKMQQRD